VCVYLCVRRWFRVLIDATKPARTVGQFRILMDRRNRAKQIVRPGRRNSQGEETDRRDGQIVRSGKWNSQGEKKKRGGRPTRGGDWRGWGQHGWGRIGGGGSSTGGGVKGGVFFSFFFFVFFGSSLIFLGVAGVA
jgi:hypothetical protein